MLRPRPRIGKVGATLTFGLLPTCCDLPRAVETTPTDRAVDRVAAAAAAAADLTSRR